MTNEEIIKLLKELKEAIKWKKWGEEIYIPYYNNLNNTDDDEEGSNPPGSPPPPPGSGG